MWSQRVRHDWVTITHSQLLIKCEEKDGNKRENFKISFQVPDSNDPVVDHTSHGKESNFDVWVAIDTASR